MHTVLALETSCDESAAAVVRDGVVLSNEVASQVEEHARYGGVVPELASRLTADHAYYGLIRTTEAIDVSGHMCCLLQQTCRAGSSTARGWWKQRARNGVRGDV